MLIDFWSIQRKFSYLQASRNSYAYLETEHSIDKVKFDPNGQ